MMITELNGDAGTLNLKYNRAKLLSESLYKSGLAEICPELYSLLLSIPMLITEIFELRDKLKNVQRS